MKTGAKVALGLGLGTGLGVLGYKIYTWLKKPPVTPVCTPGNTKCIGGDLCVCSAAGQWETSVKNSPTCVPTPGTAVLYGQVTDAQTGAAIESIQVSCNSYTGTTGVDGQHRIENIIPGDYTVTFSDSLGRYETKDMTVTLAVGLNKLDSALQLISVPGDWTEGVNIQKITVIPSIVYLGESMDIKVYTVNCQLALPATIHGTVIVNGTTLTEDWAVTTQNPTLKLTYTPTQIGTFAAKALGAAAKFTVLEDISGTYYSPFGIKRVPLCTDIIIPDVAPFSRGTYTHPGGDLIWSTLPLCSGIVERDAAMICHYDGDPLHTFSKFWVPHHGFDAVKAQLSKGQPRTWDPPSAVVSSWVGDYKSGLTPTLIITATEYSSQEYWDSRKELADMLLRIGIANVAICGGGYCTSQILCPYCNQWIYSIPHIQGLEWDTLSFVRDFLLHIETVHPDHPLTEPATA